MINVGLVGLGPIGLEHLAVYAKRADVKVVALSDKDPRRLSEAASPAIDSRAVAQYADAFELIRDKQVHLVDLCLPTHLHVDYALAALEAGKHVLVEKPLARTSQEAFRLAATAKKSSNFAMCALCMRFWPGWTWLKKAIDDRTYGKVRSAWFRRIAEAPSGAFYRNGDQCGGAILDLHIHDTDFVQHCFGMPRAVRSAGYRGTSGEVDHVVTHYQYDEIPLVIAEGGWEMAPGFGFCMQYTVNFERATASFDLAAAEAPDTGVSEIRSYPLMLFEAGKQPRAIELPAGSAYEYEIDYFLKCIQENRPPSAFTLDDAARSVQIIEAENESIATAQAARV